MRPPCIRNLPRFAEAGCPEKMWDGEEGCPAWIEMATSTRGKPQEKVVEKHCMDFWKWKFQWATLGLLEGNQEAVEKFRNAMCEADPGDPFNDNKARPKASQAAVKLLKFFQKLEERSKIIFEHEARKEIGE